MKYFSFKVLFVCILLPPLLHLATIQTLERFLKEQYRQDIENIYTGNTRMLFNGSIRLESAINNNIDKYLSGKRLVRLGAKTDVLVTTKNNTILYPTISDEGADAMVQRNRSEIAAENYRLMNEGLVVKVDVTLERDSVFVIAVFTSYYLLSLLVLYRYYRLGAKRARLEALSREKEIDRLHDIEKQQKSRLVALREDKQYLSSEFQRIKKRLQQDTLRASRNEDEFINEIVALEEKVQKSIKMVEEQQEENEELKLLVRQYEKEKQKSGKQKQRATLQAQKRFKALYKSLAFQQRAYQGYADLTEDMKIKAEEIIRQLDDDPSLVQVKRKVLMKKNPEAVFEATFAYNGRLYFTRSKEKPAEVLAIGTKNTQEKDLAFIDNLA